MNRSQSRLSDSLCSTSRGSSAGSSDSALSVANRFFWIFILIHTLFWTLGPWLVRDSLPHDTLESITWGMQWQWGYNKHPFLAAWLNAGVRDLFQASEWPVYLLAQLAVSITFIATWQLARKILPTVNAVVAALSLEGILYYNINSFNITPDSLQSPLWALLALWFYQACKTQKIRYWILVGITVALCIATKYQVAMLLIPMFLFSVLNQQARASFSHVGLYIAVVVALLLCIPHLYWLWNHDFSTIRYALGAPYDHIDSHSRVMCLLLYLTNDIAYAIGALLLLWPFYQNKHPINLETFDRYFLLFLGLGPCCLTAIFCFIHAENIPARWSTPYFFLISTMVLAWLNPQITKRTFKQFILSLVIVSVLLGGFRVGMIATHYKSRSDAYLPNKKIATKVLQLWHEHYSSPLPYLCGTHYLVGSVIPYISENPIPYFSWDNSENPWLNEQDLKLRGGIFLWDVDSNYFWDAFSPKLNTLPNSILERFPNLMILGTYTFYRTTDDLKPVPIGIALLPPKAAL